MSEARLMPFEGSTNVDGVLSLRPKARTQAARHALLCYRYGEQRVSTGPALRAWIGRRAEFSGASLHALHTRDNAGSLELEKAHGH